jgi:superoxide dismutase, Fe-Mn family
MNRRDFIVSAGVVGSALMFPLVSTAAGKEYALADLPYPADALEPHIDATTMSIHHGRHHKTYVENLNKALAGNDWLGKPLPEMLAQLDKIPEEARTAVRNNGGGHYNHSLFWQCMAKNPGKPAGDLLKAIDAQFKGVDAMAAAVKDLALKRFGSGWAWVVVAADGTLKMTSTPNQDCPLMDNSGVPLFGIDVWEHAYYLKYQNKRADYIEAFFKVLNWEFLNERYKLIKKA